MDKKTDYALRAAVYLAEKYDSGETVNTSEISAVCDMPHRFLAQILLLLKNDALIISTAGRNGGYRLMRSPEMISVAEILRSVSDDFNDRVNRNGDQAQGRYAAAVFWIDSARQSAVLRAMGEISLADILDLMEQE